MIQLSEAEEAILKFWRGYIHTKCDKSVRPVTKYLWKWKEIFMTLRIRVVNELAKCASDYVRLRCFYAFLVTKIKYFAEFLPYICIYGIIFVLLHA